ncbi:zinc finger MYM-type protein 1-like [Zingiber officinale]|uniref:zinc finger MYM-type protein 1-like n=1 Tax=Zingiber officinale TaxID=94328 RepID=UPI001C4BA889|nr:zinc finger MYM-type protein 1-like [Zingiber officinale]
MDKFLKRKSMVNEETSQREKSNLELQHVPLKKSQVEINLDDLQSDPGLRVKISNYDPNDREKVRRAYLQKGPCQPRNHNFPQRKIGKASRRFCPSWFNEFGNWLEYSISKDAAFCLCCYLFRPDFGKQVGGDSFTSVGFTNWKKKEIFVKHVGSSNSAHNQAWQKCVDLMKESQHIEVALTRQTEQARNLYRVRLTASVDCIRFLLRQGLAFRGHNESESSFNQGNFLELLKFVADHNEDIKNAVLQNAPENNQLISPEIQKDIVNAACLETTNAILNELGDEVFAMLVDESRDISDKEQMAIALRYVNLRGIVVERFLGIAHDGDTSSLSLKKAIESLLSYYGLSIARIRGQGYDGASNMRGEFNGLKSLILKDNPFAYYVHCFAHQLQLTIVAVAKNHLQVASLFNLVAIVVKVVGGSCKRQDIFREKRMAEVKKALGNGEIFSGRGLNQESGFKKAGDTRWGSHYDTLMSLIVHFSIVLDVLEYVVEDGAHSEQKAEAAGLLDSLETFDFAFTLHLLKSILGVTNELSQILQRKNQDIVNAMIQVKVSKKRLQLMRDNGWDDLLNEVMMFCNCHDIVIPDMNEVRVLKGRSRRKAPIVTNLHYYKVSLFYEVLDMQLQELNDRFTEVNTELLLCMECLSPENLFSAFDKEKLLQFAKFYPADFSSIEILALGNQLDNYFMDMNSSKEFANLKGIGSLARELVETRRDIVYPLVYKLIKLALVLPVATATVERAFSAMKIVKNRLRNQMGDRWLNDCLVTFIEKEVFDTIDNELILRRFQNMCTRREFL